MEDKIYLTGIEVTSEDTMNFKVPNFKFNLIYHRWNEDGSIDEIRFEDVVNPFVRSGLRSTVTTDGKFLYFAGMNRAGDSVKMKFREMNTTRISPATEPIEVTMDEIEKKFGRPVKIVKEVENDD